VDTGMVRGLCVHIMGNGCFPHRFVLNAVLDRCTTASVHQQLEIAKCGSTVSLVPLPVACSKYHLHVYSLSIPLLNSHNIVKTVCLDVQGYEAFGVFSVGYWGKNAV
jgi:hypothetical protein